MSATNIQRRLQRFWIISTSVALLVLAGPGAASAADGDQAYLVKDINTAPYSGTDGSGSSAPSNLTDAAGTLFFSALGQGGRELYRTDGTTVGTVRLSIRPGSRGAKPAEITALGSRVLFSADDGASGRELWVSDGSAAGTKRVKDIRPGSRGSNPRALAVMGGKLYFSANDGRHGRELWVSDATASGTRLVRDVKAGSKGSNPKELVAFGSRLFFTALAARRLWVSDGSSSGTAAFPDSTKTFDNHQLTRAGNQLFFLGDSAPDFYGSTITSIRVIRPGASRSVKLLEVDWEGCPNVNYCRETVDMVPVGPLLFVTGPTRRLWRTDGTSAGTFKLMNLNDCGSKSGRYPECSFAGAFADVAGRLFFVLPRTVFSPEHQAYRRQGDELWLSDGTIAGTRVVRLFEQASGGGWDAPGAAIALNGTYYFGAYDNATGFELWQSDGTAAGTKLASDISPSSGFDNGWSNPQKMAVSGNSLYMSANDGVHGRELWRFVP